MTPKEKAEELYKKFCEFTPVEFEQEYTKKCALIAVDEILESQPSVILVSIDGDETEYMDKKQYWKQVKQEIEKL